MNKSMLRTLQTATIKRSTFMKTAVFVIFLFFCDALHTQAQTGNIDRHRVRAEQLSYEKFAESVESTRSILMEFREITRLLTEHCNLEQIRKQRVIDTSRLPKDTTVVFKIPSEKLADYPSLGWAMQNIGFPNSVQRIAGYGLVSRAEILRLKVENMKLSNAPDDTTRKLELKYLEAQKDLDECLATQRWVD